MNFCVRNNKAKKQLTHSKMSPTTVNDAPLSCFFKCLQNDSCCLFRIFKRLGKMMNPTSH